MAGQKDRHHLVSQLPIGHSLAGFLIARRHEHRQQIAGVFTGPSSLRDEIEDEAVQRLERRFEAAVARGGEQARYVNHSCDGIVRGAQGDGHRLSDAIDIVADVGAQQRLACDPKRQPHHLRGDVGRGGAVPGSPRRQPCWGGLRAPPGEHVRRGADHGVTERRNPRAMECGLSDTALPQPVRSFARQQTVREKRPERGEAARLLAVVPIVLLKHVSDVIRMRELIDVERTQAESRDVAIQPNVVSQQRDRVAPHLVEPAEQPWRRTRGKARGLVQ
jgi:hypothetical protein